MLSDAPVRALTAEINRVLVGAYEIGISENIPHVMDIYLRNDLTQFSGFKGHSELQQVSALLRGKKGEIKPFNQFFKDVQGVHAKYNEHHLRAEYNFAISSSQMASKWVEFKAGGDRYNLQYRTAADERVRETHSALHGITLAMDDPFWDYYFAPNGWGCRCTVLQVMKSKFEVSDSESAIAKGLEATRQMRDGHDVGEIFRFNPGRLMKVMPPKHPIYKVGTDDKKTIKKVLEDISPKTIDINKIVTGKGFTSTDFKNVITSYSDVFKENYNGGLLDVVIKRSSSAFMSNGRYRSRPGNILTLHNYNFKLGDGIAFNPYKEAKDAFISIRKGKALTFNQEYAMESLWHETLHAKAVGYKNLALRNSQTTMHMETINQFIARNTYPKFIESFGGKAINQVQIIEQGYGYGRYVSNFRELLKHSKIKESEVVEAMSDKLLLEPYEDIGKSMIKFLESKGVENAEKYMNLLDKPTTFFIENINQAL